MVISSFSNRRVMVDLTPEMARLLALLSAMERREPRAQASLILEQALRQRASESGIVTTIECTSPDERDRG
jgi:hypothetical protein